MRKINQMFCLPCGFSISMARLAGVDEAGWRLVCV
jgi:hypothetical protein